MFGFQSSSKRELKMSFENKGAEREGVKKKLSMFCSEKLIVWLIAHLTKSNISLFISTDCKI